MFRINTYYDPVPEIDQEDSLRLINLWRERMTAYGFEPVVLNEWTAMKHPLYAEFNAAVSGLPSVNPAMYERSCYIRWLALAQVGGGFMSDYDVMPIQSLGVASFSKFKPEKINLFQGGCPCLVYANQAMAEQICRLFATGKYGKVQINGRDHYSDQYSICQLIEEQKTLPESERILVEHQIVKNYTADGWETAGFVHFSNSVTQPNGKSPRWKHIPGILESVK